MRLDECYQNVLARAFIGSGLKEITCENFLHACATFDLNFQDIFEHLGGDLNKFREILEDVIGGTPDYSKRLSEEKGLQHIDVKLSNNFSKVNRIAFDIAGKFKLDFVDSSIILCGFFVNLEECISYFDLCGIDAELFMNFYVTEFSFTGNIIKGTPFDVIAKIQNLVEEDGNIELLQYLMDSDAGFIKEIGKGIIAEGDFSNNSGSPFADMMGQPQMMKKPVNIEDFCTNLLEVVKTHKEPLVGREAEIDKTFRVLCRKEKCNAIHLGEAGVGKTAITLGIARAINEGNVPDKLKGAELYSLDVGGLMAGTNLRGDLEERVSKLFAKLNEKENVILYIDEIHMLMGGSSHEYSNIANLFKKALLESKIKFIGATTYDEYRKAIEQDKAFARRFKTIAVAEPTIEQTKEIIRGIIPYYSEFHNVTYRSNAIDSAVELSVKYINDRYLPDKAIDLIDEAGAHLSKNNKVNGIVTKDLIECIISENCNIPKETITKKDKNLVLNLESALKKTIYGQDSAISECVKAIKLSKAGLIEENKPLASLLFVGQTGVGKTEIARQLAQSLNIDFIKFDMSEYSTDVSVTKLIGASAGYVGYEEGGLLVEKIRKHPHCVLLLDEIEKAHPSVYDLLLQVMDDAKLTDNKGRVADFKNVIIIMTSNAGASGVKVGGLGFGSDTSYDFGKMDKAVEKTFSPEFRNRLTKIIVLNGMSKDMATKIVRRELAKLKAKLEDRGITIKFNDKTLIPYCLKHGITDEYGARPILRVINDDIKLLLVDYLIDGKVKDFTVTVKDDRVVLA